MVEREWITTTADNGDHQPATDPRSRESEDDQYWLTDRGATVLRAGGIPATVLSTSRPLRYRLDWTEQSHHVAGRLGRAVTDKRL